MSGAVLDKLQEILERDQTSEDALKDSALKKTLLATIDASDSGVRDKQGDLRSSRGASQVS